MSATGKLVFGSPIANKIVALNKKLDSMSDADKALHSPLALEERLRNIDKEIADTQNELRRLESERWQVVYELREWSLV